MATAPSSAPAASARARPPATTSIRSSWPLEQERIFDRTWQLAGHVSQLPRPGSYLTAQAGTQPVLVVRGEDGELRAFRNVCRHRASRLLSGAGQCKQAIRCRYHGWTYRLDGELIGIPEHRSYATPVDKAAHRLLPARVEELCGLLFVNLDADAPPLADARRGPPGAARALRHPDARAVRRARGPGPARELEGRRRELPRGLPHPDRPSRT